MPIAHRLGGPACHRRATGAQGRHGREWAGGARRTPECRPRSLPPGWPCMPRRRACRALLCAAARRCALRVWPCALRVWPCALCASRALGILRACAPAVRLCDAVVAKDEYCFTVEIGAVAHWVTRHHCKGLCRSDNGHAAAISLFCALAKTNVVRACANVVAPVRLAVWHTDHTPITQHVLGGSDPWCVHTQRVRCAPVCPHSIRAHAVPSCKVPCVCRVPPHCPKHVLQAPGRTCRVARRPLGALSAPSRRPLGAAPVRREGPLDAAASRSPAATP